MAVGAIVVLRSLDDGGVKGLSSTNGLDFESCSWGRRSREASPVQVFQDEAFRVRAQYFSSTLSFQPLCRQIACHALNGCRTQQVPLALEQLCTGTRCSPLSPSPLSQAT